VVVDTVSSAEAAVQLAPRADMILMTDLATGLTQRVKSAKNTARQ
jgi:hypothetical protein